MPRRVAPAHRSILAPLALIALAACGPDVTLDAGEELHPTSENAPPPDAALITTGSEPIGLSAEALTEWRAARDRLPRCPAPPWRSVPTAATVPSSSA